MSSSFLQSATDAANATSYTFTAQNVGTAAGDRYIVVGVTARKAGAAGSNPSVTVAGNAATEVAALWKTTTNSTFTGLYIVALASGTTADVVANFGASTMVRGAISMWRLDDLASSTAHDTVADGQNDPSGTIDVPVDGVCIGFAGTGASTTNSWVGITEEGTGEGVVESALTYSSARDEFPSGSSGLTVTANFGSPVESAGTFASWEFGGGGGPTSYDGTITEAGSLADTDTAVVASVGSIAETGALAETNSGLLVLNAGVIEAAALSDANTAILTMVATITEGGGLVDSVSGSPDSASTLSEAASLADVVTAELALVGMIEEPGALLDSLSAFVLFAGTIEEGATLLDRVTSGAAATGEASKTRTKTVPRAKRFGVPRAVRIQTLH